MRSTLCFCLGFFLGSAIAMVFTVRAIQRADISTVAQVAVSDVSQAYENQLDSHEVFQRFRAKYERCLNENARLKGATK